MRYTGTLRWHSAEIKGTQEYGGTIMQNKASHAHALALAGLARARDDFCHGVKRVSVCSVGQCEGGGLMTTVRLGGYWSGLMRKIS